MRSAPPGKAAPEIAAQAGPGGWRWILRDETGSATAEFAVVLPAVLLVLGIALGGLQLATKRLLLASAAADIARASARGDTDAADTRLAELSGFGGGVRRAERDEGDLGCVTLTASPGSGMLSTITLSATGCALRTRP